MNPRYGIVSARANHRCEYCLAPESAFNTVFEVDHIVPRSRGGDDSLSNLALACRSCNAHKAATQTASDPDATINEPLFDPRRACWRDHFEVNGKTFEIVGITGVGRATVAALRLNSALQLTARRVWHRLELYP